VDSVGDLFVADGPRIRKVSVDGIIATVAVVGGLAIDVAVDGSGSLFIAEAFSGLILKVSSDGMLTTVAGGGTLKGRAADGGPATSATLYPRSVAVDATGNLFIADFSNLGIRKVSPGGVITTVAGGGAAIDGDGIPATTVALVPGSVAVDAEGNLFIADTGYRIDIGGRIRKVSPDGIITTVAGVGTRGFSGDGGPATAAELDRPSGVAVDRAGNLFITDDNRIRIVSANGVIATLAGNGAPGRFSFGDGGSATAAGLDYPNGLAVDGAGNLFVTEFGNHRVRKVSTDGIITTVAGAPTQGFSGDGGPATVAELDRPIGVAVDSERNLYIADNGSNRIRRVSPDGIITTVAGNGATDFSGDGGPATSAALSAFSVATDSERNLFIADFRNHRIRKVSPDGIITTVAGTGIPGSSGDGGPATSAGMSPRGVAVDSGGNLFIADVDNDQIGASYDGTTDTLSQTHRIRKVSRDGIITTVAGGGTAHWGDGGPATSAEIRFPNGVAVDGVGNLFFSTSGADYEIPGPERVRKVSPSGIITTVAGGGTDFPGNGGPATSAALFVPSGLAVDGAGSVYVAETYNHVVRVLRPTNYSLLIGAVVDAASQRSDPVSPGKIVGIYGVGLGPSELIRNQPRDGQFSTELAGTTVSFNGIAAPILYTSATQVVAVAPYALAGTTAQVTVTHQGEASNSFTVPVAPSAPSLFTLNQTGAGQAVAINTVDGTVNTPANPVKLGGFISLYATGEGQTTPAGVDGRLEGSTPAQPVLAVRVTIGGIPATVQYEGGAPGLVAGVMQVNVQIPSGVQPGGYVSVALQSGDRSSSPAAWIAVSGK
jgi:uncharacterized protein (TIGR03437 family)